MSLFKNLNLGLLLLSTINIASETAISIDPDALSFINRLVQPTVSLHREKLR